MTLSERTASRRRWALAATASVALHLSLLAWWWGANLATGDGSAGGLEGGHAGSPGFGPGSVLEVQIDVDAPVPAGATIPAEEIAVETHATPVATTPTPPASQPTSVDTSRAESAQGGGGVGTEPGTGSGSGVGGEGSGEGFGSGAGGEPGGVGVRTGDGGGGPGGGTVPPRPIEITWPDTRKLSHCVGLRIDVRIRVDERGRVEQVEPASTGLPADCVRAALDTARRIKFTPGTVAGKPATLWTLVTIDFEKGK